jgi:hypothetical protein
VIEEKTKCRPQRKRIPVVAKYLAGSSLGIRGTLKQPQVSPSQPSFNIPTTLTLDDVAPVALPKCPHGIRLTKDEYIFERSYKRTFHKRMNGKRIPIEIRGTYFMPKSFECFDCHPVCIHGMDLNSEERKSRKRFSFNCPACNTDVKDPDQIEEFLKKQKLSVGDGMALTEGEIITSYGLPVTKAGQNHMTGGGSKDMEDRDTKSTNRGDMQARAKRPKGWDSGTYVDEQNSVNELNEPVSSVPSKTIKKAESIRSADTRSTIEGQLADPENETTGAKKLLKLEVVREDGRDDLTVPECDKSSGKLQSGDKRIFKDILKDFKKNEIPVGTKED